jgi:2-iminobutanoate/2-iminopropanoate deaminase
MKKIISTTLAPKAIGPYNQAIEVNGTVYLSGQIALDPASGTLVQNGIEAETRQVLTNLQGVLRGAGLGLQNVVKCSVFVKSMADYPVINQVYAEFFDSDSAPARELVQVSELPLSVNIEISAIAVRF